MSNVTAAVQKILHDKDDENVNGNQNINGTFHFLVVDFSSLLQSRICNMASP